MKGTQVAELTGLAELHRKLLSMPHSKGRKYNACMKVDVPRRQAAFVTAHGWGGEGKEEVTA